MKFIRILSAFFICGSGQILKHEYFRGIIFLIGFLSSLGIIFFAIQLEGFRALLFLLAGMFFALFLWIYSFIDVCLYNEIKKKEPKIDHKYDKIYLRGLAFYLNGQYQAAIKMFKLILKKNKKDPDALYQLAKTYEKKGDECLAKKTFGKYDSFKK